VIYYNEKEEYQQVTEPAADGAPPEYGSLLEMFILHDTIYLHQKTQ
jgi:hypothetical protein